MYGRESHHNLNCADYARPETNYASLPYVITAGDPLQFPPVPATSSLLAEPGGETKEHRVAQSMFEDHDYVCELKTTMRLRERSCAIQHPAEDANLRVLHKTSHALTKFRGGQSLSMSGLCVKNETTNSRNSRVL